MPGISKVDKELICALSSIPDHSHRQAIIASLDKAATEKVRKHVKYLLQNRRKQYQLPKDRLEPLVKSLRSYRGTLRKYCCGGGASKDSNNTHRGGGGGGGGISSSGSLGHAVSALIPVIAEVVSRRSSSS